jgi:hypothetical protein
MVKLLSMERSLQTRLDSLVTSILSIMVSSAHLILNLDSLHARATTRQAGARILGATLTLATAMILVLDCQTTSAQQQAGSLSITLTPLVVVQMDTMPLSAQPLRLKVHAMQMMSVPGQVVHALCHLDASLLPKQRMAAQLQLRTQHQPQPHLHQPQALSRGALS